MLYSFVAIPFIAIKNMNFLEWFSILLFAFVIIAAIIMLPNVGWEH